MWAYKDLTDRAGLFEKTVRIGRDGKGGRTHVVALSLYPYFTVADTAKREAMAQSYFCFAK